MDIVTYALAKKMASSVASGITEIETNGTNIRFKTASGDWFSVTLNSISEASVSANGHLIVKLSDGAQIDCGALPVGTMDTALSATSENGVQNKVITAALNGKQNTLVQGSGITIDTTDPTHPQISANIDYANLINKPTKLSDFTNDENFITNTANNLSNYYLKTETYTQSEVNDLISQLASLSVEIVESLPTTDISTTTIYLINVSGTNNYNQWMYINNTWSNIGSTSVDLTNYYTKTQTDTLLADKVDKVSGKGLSTNDFTNSYKSVLDNYTVDSTLDSSSTNPIQNAVVTQALDAKQPKTLSSPITIGGTSQTTVESALGGLNSLCGTKLTMVTSLPLTPSNQETVLYIGNSSGGLLCGGIYQYQVSEWVMISNVSSFTFNSDEFAVDSATNEISLKPSYADIPSFLPNNVSSSNKLATKSSITAITNLIPNDASASNKLVTQNELEETVKDITINIPYAKYGGDYVIPLGNILEPTSTATDSPYNWDITGFLSVIRASGHGGLHINFEAGHGYSHNWITYAFLDAKYLSAPDNVHASIKAFQYNGKWWLGLYIATGQPGYDGKMTITYSRNLPATPTCILYNYVRGGVVNEEIYNSIQDIPSSWWRGRTIYNPTTFTQNITAPNITSLEQRIAALESRL